MIDENESENIFVDGLKKLIHLQIFFENVFFLLTHSIQLINIVKSMCNTYIYIYIYILLVLDNALIAGLFIY